MRFAKKIKSSSIPETLARKSYRGQLILVGRHIWALFHSLNALRVLPNLGGEVVNGCEH